MIPLASDLLPFPGQMRREGLLEFASRQTGFSSSGRIVIVGPIHRKCPAVVVVAVDKIAERCKQATESLGSDRSRENAEDPHRALAGYRKIPAQDDGGRPEENAPALGQLRDAQTITERLWEIV